MNLSKLTSSIENILSDRFKSPMYGSFIISWCFWNWKFIYITIFIDQELILQIHKLLKYEYILTLYNTSFWNVFFVKSLIAPIITTYILIWFMPILGIHCLKKYNSFKLKEDKSKQDMQAALDAQHGEFAVQQKIQKGKERSNTVNLNDEDQWDLDYTRLKKGPAFLDTMKYFRELLYEYHGNLSRNYESIYFGTLDTNDLVIKSADDNSGEWIEATSKGKYFLKKYLNNDFFERV